MPQSDVWQHYELLVDRLLPKAEHTCYLGDKIIRDLGCFTSIDGFSKVKNIESRDLPQLKGQF